MRRQVQLDPPLESATFLSVVKKLWNWLWSRKWAIWLVIPLWLFIFIWWD